MSFAIIRNDAIEQLLYGDVDPTADAVAIPESLLKLQPDRLIWNGETLADAATLNQFFIDAFGRKFGAAGNGRQPLVCSYQDVLVQEEAGWRVANAGDALVSLKTGRIALLTAKCAQAIIGGYSSSALGTEHQYPSKETDQINMMGSVTDSLLPGQAANWSTPFWCADESGAWAFRPHTAPQIQAAGADGKAHILECQTKLGQLSAQVMAAASAEAVAAIGWED